MKETVEKSGDLYRNHAASVNGDSREQVARRRE
jgi:hypothetical protein